MNASRKTGGRARAFTWAAGALILGIASYVIGVRSELGQQAEASVLVEAEFTTNPPAPLNLVSVPSVALAIALLGLLALAVHGLRSAIVVAAAAAVAIGASQLLKLQFLDRPELFELDAPNTFPSGHMTVFAVLVAAAIWAVPSSWRSIVGLLGALLLGVVAWQLIVYGWHRPSDILGALALTVFSFALAALVSPRPGAQRAALGFAVQVILLIVAGGTFVLALVALSIATLSDSSARMMLLAGQAGVVSASTLCTIVLISLSARRT